MDTKDFTEALENWAEAYIPRLEDLVVEAAKSTKKKNSQYTLTFAIWTGPQGTGKGTNIDAMSESCELLIQAYESKQRHIPTSILPLLKMNTEKKCTIITGTGGMTNVPKGEYAEMFSEFQKLIGNVSASGGLIGDKIMTLLVELMVILRIVEGYTKIQIDLWPRTTNQMEFYDSLVFKLRVAGIITYSDMVNLRLLTQQEITAMKENVIVYAKKSIEIGQRKMHLLKEGWFLEEIRPLQTMNPSTEHERMYALSAAAVEKITKMVKDEYHYETETATRIILDEADRAMERVKYRYDLSVKLGETPRSDAWPHYQLKRIALFETETSPSFIKASLNHDVSFISSYQSPAAVVADILESAIIRFEKGIFKQEYPTVWSIFLEVAGQFADDIVAKRQTNREELMKKLAGALL